MALRDHYLSKKEHWEQYKVYKVYKDKRASEMDAIRGKIITSLQANIPTHDIAYCWFFSYIKQGSQWQVSMKPDGKPRTSRRLVVSDDIIDIDPRRWSWTPLYDSLAQDIPWGQAYRTRVYITELFCQLD